MVRFFCFFRGKVVFVDSTPEVASLVREVVEKTGEPTQNILAKAFHKYGVSEDSIRTHCNEILRKLKKT